MRERRRDYELMFIISPLRSSEEDITNTINRVRQAVASAGGEVTAVDHSAPWGRRKFAYPIREYAEGEASRRPFTEGYYVLSHFSLPTTQIPAVERSLKLNDSILRYLLTLVDSKAQVTLQLDSASGDAAAAAADTAEDEDEDELDGEDQGDEDEE
jgi:small subunit ribosomal protein S6